MVWLIDSLVTQCVYCSFSALCRPVLSLAVKYFHISTVQIWACKDCGSPQTFAVNRRDVHVMRLIWTLIHNIFVTGRSVLLRWVPQKKFIHCWLVKKNRVFFYVLEPMSANLLFWPVRLMVSLIFKFTIQLTEAFIKISHGFVLQTCL